MNRSTSVDVAATVPRRIAWLVALFAPCACDSPTASVPTAPLLANATPTEVFAVLDRFEPRDVTGFPFVSIATGWPARLPEPGATPRVPRHGFLLADDGRRFVVQDLDGTRREFTHTPPNTPEWRRIGHSPADLVEHANEVAEHLPDSSLGWMGYRVTPFDPVSAETYAWLTAHACARTGRDDAVATLLRRLARGTWSERLPGDLANIACLALEDPTLHWSDHLARFELLASAWPDDRSAETWVHDRDAIRAWIDAGTAQLAADEVRTASDAELVDGLADVCMPWNANWASMPFHWPAPAGAAIQDPPAVVVELVRRGQAVVPLLAAHLDDKRASRSWTWCSRKSGGLSMRTLGDNARRALVEIVGSAANDAHFDAASWCASVAMLDRRTRLLALIATEDEPWAAVHALLASHPDAFDEVLACLWPAGGPAPTWQLPCLHAAANLHSRHAVETVLARLEAELTVPDRERRTQAAFGLFELGLATGSAVLVANWDEGRIDDDTPWERVVLLGNHVAWDGIARHLLEPEFARVALPTLARLPPRLVLANATAEARARIPRLLREALPALLTNETIACEQASVVAGATTSTMTVVTFADLAAGLLAAWFPGSYSFDAAASGSQRRLQVHRMRELAPVASRSPTPTATPTATRPVAEIVFLGGADAWPRAVQTASARLVGSDVTPDPWLEILRTGCMAAPGMACRVTFERVPGTQWFVAVLGHRTVRDIRNDGATEQPTVRLETYGCFVLDDSAAHETTKRLPPSLHEWIDQSLLERREFTLEVERRSR